MGRARSRGRPRSGSRRTRRRPGAGRAGSSTYTRRPRGTRCGLAWATWRAFHGSTARASTSRRPAGGGAGGRGRRRSALFLVIGGGPRGRRRPARARTRRPPGAPPTLRTRPGVQDAEVGSRRPGWPPRCRRSRGAARRHCAASRSLDRCRRGPRSCFSLEQGEEPVGVEVLDHHRLSHRVHFEHTFILPACAGCGRGVWTVSWPYQSRAKFSTRRARASGEPRAGGVDTLGLFAVTTTGRCAKPRAGRRPAPAAYLSP